MSSPRVLVVEDKPHDEARIRQALGEAGCVVHTASRGAQALALCQKHSFEAVLLDLLLPDMPGLSVLEALREDPRFKTVPIVLFGALDIEHLTDSLRQTGLFGDDGSGTIRRTHHSRAPAILEPPPPSELGALRQRAISQRFVRWTAMLGLAAVMYVNLAVALLAPGWYSSSPTMVSPTVTGLLVVVLGGLPLLGLLGVVWSSQRPARAALAAARRVLGVQEPQRDQRLLGALLFGLLGMLIPAAVLLYEAERTLLCMVLGVLVPLGRRQADPTHPLWALILLGIWSALGGVWMVTLGPVLGPSLAFYAGICWIVLSPFGLPLLPLRHRLARWAERPGPRGELARAWVVFLPAAQAARVRRVRGDPWGAMSVLRARLAGPLGGRLLGEALLEAGEVLLELGDRRALGMFAAAARLMPRETAPFFGLARAYRTEDADRALAYVRFAEENDQRRLWGRDPAVTALREELERR
jgi:CheY-like chemotaxis protein